MKTKADFQLQTEFALLLIGEPGAGKTCASLCFPKPYIINLDKKLINAVKTFPNVDFKYDDIQIDPPLSATDLQKKSTFWEDLGKCIDEAIKDPEVETIIIDSLSSLDKGLSNWIIRHPGAKPGTQCDLKTLSEPLWGVFGQMLENMMIKMRYSGKRFVLLCHLRMTESDQDRRRLLPAIGGSMKNKLAALFTDYWQCFTRRKGTEVQHMIRTRPDHEITLFESVGAPDEFQVTPENMIKVLKGELK